MNKTITCFLYLILVCGASLAPAAVPIPAEKEHAISLNGTWRFKLEQPGGYDSKTNHGGRPVAIVNPATIESFQTIDYKEDKAWVDLNVPGNWEMAGLSPATYNQPDNASGLYRVWFDVPKTWQGRLIRLTFDGVQNGSELWLNGKPVAVDEPSWGRTNYHESGWTAFQLDLTPAVKFGKKICSRSASPRTHVHLIWTAVITFFSVAFIARSRSSRCPKHIWRMSQFRLVCSRAVELNSKC